MTLVAFQSAETVLEAATVAAAAAGPWRIERSELLTSADRQTLTSVPL